MVTYAPGATFAHRLDPRSKIAFQIGVAVAAVARPTPPRLAALTLLGLAALAVARLSIRRVLWDYRFLLLLLAFGPALAAVVPGSPWVRPARAVEAARSAARVVPVLLVSAAFVHTTPARETRAAVQRHVPGRAGQLLGVGVGLTVRLLPVVRADVARAREAISARGGQRRSLRDRAGRLVALSVARALDRSDRLALALRARCFAWNPTLPALAFARRDYPVLAAALALALSPLL
ncbi:MAG: energy-coupling factor transporter transmembrane protein EcfT [Haloarculaceae archaeon]